MFKQIKIWFSNHPDLFFWRNQNQETESSQQRSLYDLPATIKNKLIDTINNLASNFADEKAIADAIEEAFEQWQKDPERANNSVVILGSPVTAVSRILATSLEDWAEQKQIPIRLLPLKARPNTLETIKSELEQFFDERSHRAKSPQHPSEVVVIPNLSWYFLRSLEGLDGIEYLEFLLCDNIQDRFWIIGANQIAWEYLNLVCHLQAYCGEVVVLPEITAKDLQEWLDPLVNQLELSFAQPPIKQQLIDKDKKAKTDYFERLASVSQGVSSIAVQIFLKSIRSQKETEEKSQSQSQSQADSLIAQTPQLPDLSTLEPVDQYILYSLLLHDRMTISALAMSLGDDESEVQARVRLLHRQGVVERKEKTLIINPLYYPQIKQQLANNNFIIEKQ